MNISEFFWCFRVKRSNFFSADLKLVSLKKIYANRRNLLKCFTTLELMRWPGIESLYSPILRATPTFSESTEDGKKRWEELHKRVVEHVSLSEFQHNPCAEADLSPLPLSIPFRTSESFPSTTPVSLFHVFQNF